MITWTSAKHDDYWLCPKEIKYGYEERACICNKLIKHIIWDGPSELWRWRRYVESINGGGRGKYEKLKREQRREVANSFIILSCI